MSVREGAAGGSLSKAGSGGYAERTFTAPSVPGTYDVDARFHEVAMTEGAASATITVPPRRSLPVHG